MHKILQNHLLCAFVANLKIGAIYALYPESFCEKNLAIRKVFAFCKSAPHSQKKFLLGEKTKHGGGESFKQSEQFEEAWTTFCVHFFAFDGQEALDEKYVSIFPKMEFCQDLLLELF